MERGGIVESLTKVFVRILKERPEDPTQYLLHNLGDARLQADNMAYLQAELEDARVEIQRLSDIIRSINPDLLNETPNKISTPRHHSLEDVNSNELQHDATSSHHQMDYSSPGNGGTLEESFNHTHVSSMSSEGDVVQKENNCIE